ncbi:RIP metalloprotease RseP [Shimazuella sp. AN120528]|nr:RIP metalloprotease RseP [Shimazuella soli]
MLVHVLQTVVSFVLVLSVLVFVHELGHFLLAKRAGILVREFAIGFGPIVFSRRKGETLYAIRLLPLGGFVRMAGEDPEIIDIKPESKIYLAFKNDLVKDVWLFEPVQAAKMVSGSLVEMDTEKDLFLTVRLETGEQVRYPLHREAFIHLTKSNEMQIAPLDRQFSSKTVGQKALTILAGPVFNIILTIILFGIYTSVTGIEAKLPIHTVTKDSPAQKAGLKPGDLIESVNGQRVSTIDMLRVQLVNSKGKPVPFLIKRGNQELHLNIAPKKQGEVYIIGTTFDERQMKRKATIGETIQEGFKQTYNWSVVILDGFRSLVTGQISVKSLGGPAQMGYLTGKAADAGFIALIKWTALLSLNLGIFNLLPIPALDGSRLFFIIIEGLRGRPINPNKESLVHFVGFAMLMMLMIFVTYNDIVKIFFT